MQKLLGVIAVSGVVAILAACGSGGSDNSSTSTVAAPSIPSTQASVTVANAGTAQNVTPGTTVTLDGSKSLSATGGTLAYNWTLATKPAASKAILTNAASPTPTFTADVAGTYTATLIVNDGTNTSTPVSVTVNVNTGNVAPVANAGRAQNVVPGTTVTLDGTASSDFNGDQLNYSWTLSKIPAGSSASLSDIATGKKTFRADVAGEYQATLVVNDGALSSAASTVIITAATSNLAPVAVAGAPQTVLAGTLVSLDGSGSTDANGDSLTYSWTLTSKPPGSAAALVASNTSRPSFTADIEGTYVATVVVSDGKSPSVASTVAVTATTPKYLGISYRATNGLDVTLNSMTKVDQGNGYVNYTINYTQTNPTATAIDEATFKLYLNNVVPMPQYGFFDRVYPSVPVSRSYSFMVPVNSTPTVLEYDANHFFSAAPIPGALQWNVPVAAAPVIATSLKLYQTDSITGNREFTMPYASTLSFNNTVIGSASSTLQQYQLTAIGQNYTVTAVKATDSTGRVVPRFEGITSGTVVQVGTTVPFALVTPLTGGQNVNLTYSFTIQETGKTFIVNANGKTN